MYINDLLDEIISKGKLFADDAKIFRPIKYAQDIEILQNDLLKLQNWSEKWLLQFNEKKCKVMHVGAQDVHYHRAYYTPLRFCRRMRIIGHRRIVSNIENQLLWYFKIK